MDRQLPNKNIANDAFSAEEASEIDDEEAEDVENIDMRENQNWEQDLIKGIRDRKFECLLYLRQLTE